MNSLEDQGPTSGSESEADIFDIALVFINNLKLLLLGPLLAAAAVGAGLWAWPGSYQSEAVQTGDLLLVAMYNSVGVQDAVAQKLFSQLQAQDPAAARKKVAQAIKVSFNNKDKTVRLTALGPTPQLAQALLKETLIAGSKLNESRTSEIARLKT